MFRVDGRYLTVMTLTLTVDVLTKMLDLLYKVVSHAICQSPRLSLGANIITGTSQAFSPLLSSALLIIISRSFQSIKAGEINDLVSSGRAV